MSGDVETLVNYDDPAGSIDRLHERATYLSEIAARYFYNDAARAARLRKEATSLIYRAAKIRSAAGLE